MTAPETTASVVQRVDVVGVDGNRPRGHIALGPPQGPPTITFTDMGPVLRIWSFESGDLTPDTARALADELAQWADRKDMNG